MKTIFVLSQDVTHIDEKWFYMKQKYHQFVGENEPGRFVKQRARIGTIIVLLEVAKCRCNSLFNYLFNRFWPLVQHLTAQR